MQRGLKDMDDDSLLMFGNALGENRSITCINFAHCELGRKNMMGFLHNLSHNVSIWKLDLSRNDLDVGGAKAIAEFIKENIGVTHLNLMSNRGIGTEGGNIILEALEHNPSIYVLQMAGCNLGAPVLIA